MRGNKHALVATLTVLFVLASFSVACGSFKKYKCRSMQSEAQMNLQSLAASMEAHRAEFGVYPKSMDELMKSSAYSPIESQYYEYSLVATDDEFTIVAEGVGDMSGDGWKLTQNMEATNVVSACN